MTTEEQQATSDPLRPNVRTFKPSTFKVSQFEVVAEGTIATEFSPEQFTIIEGRPQMVDPMFEVYDGLVGVESPFEEELPLDVEDASFVADREVTEEPTEETSEGSCQEEGAEAEAEEGGEIDESIATSVELSEHSPEVEEPLVAVSELELLRKEFDEERIALQAEHEKQLQEMKAALQQEITAEVALESDAKRKAIEERYRTIIDDMEGQIRQEVEAVERRAVEFAIQVTRKLVGTIVEIHPEYILQILKEAVKMTGGATIKAIRVSPQDLEFIKMLSPDRQCKEFDGSWSFTSDDTIRAGCVIETSSGEVEFDLDKAWERIKESVTKVR